MKNYYHILGLSFEANPELEVISAAYKALVKLYHPDIFKGEKKFQKRKITEINEAYEFLSSPERKFSYDIKLEKFQKKNSSDLLNEDFEDSDIFDDKYIDNDWEIAQIVYPELTSIQKKLSMYSKQISLQYQFYLLETKDFHNYQQISKLFINSFLDRKFGNSKRIKKLAGFLIENNLKKQALYLNKLIKVIGGSSETRILKSFFDKYIDVEIIFKQKNNIENKNLKNIIKIKKLGLYVDYIPIIILVALVLFLFFLVFFPELYK